MQRKEEEKVFLQKTSNKGLITPKAEVNTTTLWVEKKTKKK